MGTSFFYDKMLPAADRWREPDPGHRQLEIFRPSGEEHIEIRIGDLGDEHQGSGYAVRVDKDKARELIDGLERALGYMGWID